MPALLLLLKMSVSGDRSAAEANPACPQDCVTVRCFKTVPQGYSYSFLHVRISHLQCIAAILQFPKRCWHLERLHSTGPWDGKNEFKNKE